MDKIIKIIKIIVLISKALETILNSLEKEKDKNKQDKQNEDKIHLVSDNPVDIFPDKDYSRL